MVVNRKYVMRNEGVVLFLERFVKQLVVNNAINTSFEGRRNRREFGGKKYCNCFEVLELVTKFVDCRSNRRTCLEGLANVFGIPAITMLSFDGMRHEEGVQGVGQGLLFGEMED